MTDEDVSVVRAAYEAYGRGEVNRLLELVHPDLEWTYLDPSMAVRRPQLPGPDDRQGPNRRPA